VSLGRNEATETPSVLLLFCPSLSRGVFSEAEEKLPLLPVPLLAPRVRAVCAAAGARCYTPAAAAARTVPLPTHLPAFWPAQPGAARGAARSGGCRRCGEVGDAQEPAPPRAGWGG